MLGERRLGPSGRAAFETFPVLTRLPGAARPTPDGVLRLLAADLPENRHLSANGAAAPPGDVLGMRASGGTTGTPEA